MGIRTRGRSFVLSLETKDIADCLYERINPRLYIGFVIDPIRLEL